MLLKRFTKKGAAVLAAMMLILALSSTALATIGSYWAYLPTYRNATYSCGGQNDNSRSRATVYSQFMDSPYTQIYAFILDQATNTRVTEDSPAPVISVGSTKIMPYKQVPASDDNLMLYVGNNTYTTASPYCYGTVNFSY